MTTFDKREQSFEAAFAHDEEMRFLARARRDKWLGLWAAEKLGKSGEDATAYATALVAADVAGASDAAIVARLAVDFTRVDSPVTEADIRLKMVELLAKAVVALRA